MELQTQSLSKDIETEGLDLQTGETWFYPTNYPIRDYQFNIIQEALFKNTLVSLPTGLGKTFVAAVVMYNFYRWYPEGKVIFMAPTRPLVNQQIDACYNIMAIPENATAKLTGTKPSASRPNVWLNKRVFFITPQVLQNDLETVAQLGAKIKCLVFDEAHKARGNHAYCQVIRKLMGNNHKYFRILALSATPGGSIKDVVEVTQNLLISHLEFKTEESLDVMKYVFHRSLETLVVQLDDKIVEVRDEYLKIIEYYARTLLKYNVIQGNCGSLTKGKIFMLMKDFQNKNRGSNSSNYSEIMRCLNICVTLYHAFELLIRHGLRNFLSFFDEHIEKPLLRGNAQLRAILENVRDYLGPIPNIEILPDGTYPEIPDNIKFGHPKHYKLREILTTHFSDKEKDTRVIVFFEYRESVMEAHTLLLQSRPLIQPKIFLGKGSGITQKTQLGVIKAFKEGKCNTLLSTCIGEEGLDVGEVDLIVCFDISTKSPIRMVQRMGRTGRKRAGSILVLVTEGREQQTLKDCLIHKNNISTHVLGSVYLKSALHSYSPRLLPKHMEPRCVKMFMTVKTEKKNTIIEKLANRTSKSPKITCIEDYDDYKFEDRIPETKMKSFSYSAPTESENPNSFFNKHIDKMRTLQKFNQIGHSMGSQTLTDLLCYADSKRFNIPNGAQGSVKASDIRGKSLKQGDIRNMFNSGKRNNAATETVIDLIQSQLTSQANSHIQKDDTTVLSILCPSDDLFKMLSNYLMADITTNFFKCTICPKNFDCSQFVLEPSQLKTSDQSEIYVSIPSDAVVNKITLEYIEDLIATIDCNFYFAFDKEMVDSDSSTPTESCEVNEPSKSKMSFFEAPKSYSNVLSKISHEDFDSQSGDQSALRGNNIPQEITNEKLLDFFRLDFDTNQDITETALLEFFNLKSYCDIFDKSTNSSQNTVIYSPDVHLLDVAMCDPPLEDEMSNHLVDLCGTPRKMLRLCSQSELKTEMDNETKPSPSNSPHDISELCDLSFFGLSDFRKPEQPSNIAEKRKKLLFNESMTITQMVEILQKPTGVESVNPRTGNSLDKLRNTNIIDLTHCDTDDEDDSFLKNIVSQKGSRKQSETSIIKKHLNSSQLSHSIKPKIMNSPSTSKEARQNTSFAFINKCKDISGSSKIIQKHVSSDDSLEDFSIEDVKQSSKAKLIQSPLSPAVRSFSRKRHVGRRKQEIREPKKQAKAFMCLEAVVSDEENVIVSDDEEETGPDIYDGSFVNDKTTRFDTQMHAVYLKSIRSPAHHKALQRRPPDVNRADVYSQYPIHEDNEYVNDSFCVGEDENTVTEQSQLSQLDILELQLKEKKRRKNSAKSNSTRAKRKRIKYMPIDESD